VANEFAVSSKLKVNSATGGVPPFSVGGSLIQRTQTNKEMVSDTYALTTSYTELTILAGLTTPGFCWFQNADNSAGTVVVAADEDATGEQEAFQVPPGVGYWVYLAYNTTYSAKAATGTAKLTLIALGD